MKKPNMIFMRGARLHQCMLNEDDTYNNLYGNIVWAFPHTRKRQHIAYRVNIGNLTFVSAIPSKTLTVNAIAYDTGSRYNTTIIFNNILYHKDEEKNQENQEKQENQENQQGIIIQTTNNGEQTIDPIDLHQTNVKVKCNCLDFFYRFATWNGARNSLIGPVPPPYFKTTNRPPVNPHQVPGVCKHIIKTVETLRQAGVVK